MLTCERRDKILALIREKKSVSAKLIASEFYISEATVRRDLNTLEQEGLIRRTHGGALLAEGRDKDMPLSFRENDNIREKRDIAEKALTLIHDDDVIMMDSSTTALILARRLHIFRGLTVITNGIRTANALSAHHGLKVICTGGYIRENSFSMVGQHACESIARYNADLFLFSCCGFSTTQGITESTDEEALIKQKMFACSAKRVLLCDSTKFDKVFLSKTCRADELDTIVFNAPPPPAIEKDLREAKVGIVVK